MKSEIGNFGQMPNRLSASLSPYLQQHKDNPVDWYPWSGEALLRARNEKRPIFLSIGYSSCHWCHVMERESFSDPRIADILNRHFVCIKVDREERPDLDHVYMTALQMMTGQGGWPLNVFLTPDLKPFFCGTYFAPDSRYGRPPFGDLLLRVVDIFNNQADLVKKNTDQLVGMLAQQGQFFDAREQIDDKLREATLLNLKKAYDPEGGGLGGAPKFFHVDGLRFLLKEAVEKNDSELLGMVTHSLNQMASGGVYDHVGGGFHRYSTDAAWQVPHFEKMLYDNALLSSLYLETYQVTENTAYRSVITGTLDWVLREMTSKDGGFYSAIDADSEHHEGKFYVWSEAEIDKLVPQELGIKFKTLYNITRAGNFEGQNIPHLSSLLSDEDRAEMKPALDILLAERKQRIWPLIDRKVLTSWNGLMITAFAKASRVLGEPNYLTAAERSADFIWRTAFKDSHLSHVSFESTVGIESFLEDYAYFAESLLDLFEVTLNRKYFDQATKLAEILLANFYDPEFGGFWTTQKNQADLLIRSKEIFDGAVPAPFHLALSVLNRLFELTGDSKWREPLKKSIQSILGSALESPGGFHRLALVVDEFVRGSRMIVATSPESERELAISKKYVPRGHIFIWKEKVNLENISLFQAKWSSAPKLYLCESGACQEVAEFSLL
ncbi:MAG: hypothetical protein JWQ35_1415 [Bacteriovoracaceae bacterium]|nr:hypothetical protein [Bacteriovoracaceae bacterium]